MNCSSKINPEIDCGGKKQRTKMQQLEVDVRIFGVLFDVIVEGKRQVGIIRKGQPIPTSITEDNFPVYRKMSRAERKMFTVKKVHKV